MKFISVKNDLPKESEIVEIKCLNGKKAMASIYYFKSITGFIWGDINDHENKSITQLLLKGNKVISWRRV